MNTFQKKCTVVKSEAIGPDIYRISFSGFEIAKYAKPGQFIMLKIAEGNDPLLRRPFSIHQITDNGTLQILFKVVGKGTKFLATLKVGDVVDIIGPLGAGFDFSGAGGHCLVGGGMGIAPMLYLAKEIIHQNKPIELKVLLGAQSSAEIATLLLNFSELGVEIIHATDDGSSGHHGFVTELLEPALKSSAIKEWSVHCCGPQPMMREVSKKCGKNGWPCWVSMETMMACGVGACLGCTINGAEKIENQNYLHVCKDGPVFKSTDIEW